MRCGEKRTNPLPQPRPSGRAGHSSNIEVTHNSHTVRLNTLYGLTHSSSSWQHGYGRHSYPAYMGNEFADTGAQGPDFLSHRDKPAGE